VVLDIQKENLLLSVGKTKNNSKKKIENLTLKSTLLDVGFVENSFLFHNIILYIIIVVYNTVV
jgi:hypothetical protein